jgi:site-specific DNA-methyltransferase (adenine-specific)
MIINQQQIIVADCLTELATMPSQSIDAAITSPPYNIGAKYNSYFDLKSKHTHTMWLQSIAKEIARVLKPDGSFFLNLGNTSVDPWFQHDVITSWRDFLVLQNHIIWVKSISIGDDSVGHFKPINSKRFLNNNHESIFHFTLDGKTTIDRLAVGVPFKDKTNISRRGHAQDKRCAGNIWYIPYETVQSKAEKFNHPTGFPVALPERCLKMTGHATGVVLDPFLGTGTTLVAAQRLGWKGIGIEIDQQYADTAAQRLLNGRTT